MGSLSLPADFFVTSTAFTKTTHTEKYPAVDPEAPGLAQTGKVVVITGANRGLGRKAFAPAFAKANAKAIVLIARNIDSLHEVEKDITTINSHVQVVKAEADITDSSAVENIFTKVKDAFGTADVLINNAGVWECKAPIADAAANSWWRDWEVNVKGAFLMTQGFIKLVGREKPCTVINLATAGSLGIYPNFASYAVSKMAVVHLQNFVAVESPNVAAMSLDPCLADTDMLLPDLKDMQLVKFDLIGSAAVWLSTEKARFMSGRWFTVTWDVEELVARKEEIERDNQLVFSFKGELGKTPS